MTTNDRLALLFRRRDRAAATLAEIDRAIQNTRPVYAAEHGLRAYPAIAVMRREVIDAATKQAHK